MNAWRLDSERIRRLCVANQMSLRQLGDAIGAGGGRIEHLLGGTGSIDFLSLRELMKLGERLGVDGIELVVPSSRADSGAADACDAAKLHAVLATNGAAFTYTELAKALGWDFPRVKRALWALDDDLVGLGQMVHRVTASSIALRARDSVLSGDERARAQRVQGSRQGLDRRTARVLLHVALRGGEPSKQSRKTDAYERSSLLKHGLLIAEAGSRALRLHPDVAFSLGMPDGQPRAEVAPPTAARYSWPGQRGIGLESGSE